MSYLKGLASYISTIGLLTITLMFSCSSGVSLTEFESLQADYEGTRDDLNAAQSQVEELEDELEEIQIGIAWSYGTGVPGNGDGELWTPHMVEDLGENKLLIVEQTNCDVIIIDKQTKKIVWQFGERGVAGTGTRLSAPHSARQLPSGPYNGDIVITEFRGDRRVLIVDYETKLIVWEYSGLISPLDAIYWDDEHVMVSDASRIVKIRLSDKTVVWEHETEHPFYLQKLIKRGADQWEYGNSYGGDLLFGRHGTTPSTVTEIDTSNNSIKWEFGGAGTNVMAADKLFSPVGALRYGSGENETTAGSAITIVADEGNSRIVAVNQKGQILWEIGGVSLNYYMPISWLIEPTYVTVSKNGNLLIVDGMGCKIYEVVYPPLSPMINRESKYSTTILLKDSIGTAQSTILSDCGIIDLYQTTSLAITVESTYHVSATAGIAVHIYTSYDGVNWDTIEQKDESGNPAFGDMPFTPGSIQRKTKDITCGARYIRVTIENKDPIQAVSSIQVTATL